MRQRESEYWDKVAESGIKSNGGIYDNWSKRHLLAQFLLKCHWAGQKVLEIGVGHGATAALLALSCGKSWDYVGTDTSLKFCESASRFGLKMVQTDVLNLPDGNFTRIIALDSLEHVRPEDRDVGYREIAKRLVPGGLMFINMPLDRSLHEDEFDHGIDLEDVIKLRDNGLKLQRYERYEIQYGNYRRDYAFVVMTK